MALLVTERALRDRRRGLWGWAAGIAAYVGLMTAFYPAVRNSEIQRAIRAYPKEMKAFFGGAQSFDFSTGHGYLNVELFSLVVPALLVIVAIGYGAATLAGEQETGTLDLLLANPVTRGRVVLEKAAGLAATILVLAGVVAASILAVGLVVDLRVGIDRILIATLGAALVALLTGELAMLVGAATGSRAAAIGVATGLFAASYLVVGLAGLVSWFKAVRILSPLYHANGTNPLQNGLPMVNYLVLATLCVLVLAATLAVFDRRDLTR